MSSDIYKEIGHMDNNPWNIYKETRHIDRLTLHTYPTSGIILPELHKLATWAQIQHLPLCRARARREDPARQAIGNVRGTAGVLPSPLSRVV